MLIIEQPITVYLKRTNILPFRVSRALIRRKASANVERLFEKKMWILKT